jgi:Trypsin/Alpha-lytic protease prodomain
MNVFRNRKTVRTAIAVSMALLIHSAYGTVSLTEQTNEQSSLFDEMQEAIERDLGMNKREALRYQALTETARHVHHEAMRTYGSGYAGTWMERDTAGQHRIVTATTEADHRKRIADLETEIRIVSFSLSYLEAAISQLNEYAKDTHAIAPITHIQSWFIDLPTNRIVITTDPGAEKEALAMMLNANINPAMVTLRSSSHRAQPASTLRPGDVYYALSLFPQQKCSVAFAVKQGARKGFVTAGHCGSVNEIAVVSTARPVTSGSSKERVGVFVGSVYPGSDYAVVELDATSTANTQVNRYGSTSLNIPRTVVGNQEAPIGSQICRTGITTGMRCGTILAKNTTYIVNGSPIYGLTKTNACALPGDSGGAFITPAGEAQGITSLVGTFVVGQCPSESYFQPLQPVLNAYNIVLDFGTNLPCGRMNAGRVLTSGQSLTSCNGVFSLDMESSGSLSLYRVSPTRQLLWSTYTSGANPSLSMQADGNLVISGSAGLIWSTNTQGQYGAMVKLQDDGNAVLFGLTGNVLAATGTAGR